MKTPIVRIREGELIRPWGQRGVPWRQCEIISDGRVIIVYMEPAVIAGWNFGRVEVQGHESWCGMSARGIVAFKAGDKCARLASDEERASILDWLASQSAAVAA